MNFTAEDLRDMAECDAMERRAAALREYADIKEAAEKGVTDEVVELAARTLCSVNGVNPDRSRDMVPEWVYRKHDAHAALLAVAPLLALKGDKP
jgi:hypothetical protein